MPPPHETDEERRERTEQAIRQAATAGDYHAATTHLIEAYGPEVLGFLTARFSNADDACEVFAIASEKAWLALPDFEWRCSARGWLYAIARNVANTYAQAGHRRPGRHVALSQIDEVTALVARVRERTERYRRTEEKTRLQQLRERLSEPDQTLLVLRVDKGLAWRDLARIMAEQDEVDDLDTVATRLRQRFQVVKDKLRAMARSEGLV